MTPAQKARTAGAYASKKIRGVSVSLGRGGQVFTAVIEKIPVPASDKQISQEMRNVSVLNFLKTDLGEVEIVPGNVFYDSAAAIAYRVTKVGNEGIDIWVRCQCEESPIA